MAITGKYKFDGISKGSSTIIRAALLESPFGALFRIPFFQTLLEMFLNWMANKGLVVMNLGAYKVGNYVDAKALSKAMEDGWAIVDSGKKLTPEEIKRIDDAVIKAANKALPYGRSPHKP